MDLNSPEFEIDLYKRGSQPGAGVGPQQPVEERRLFELKSIFHREQQLPSSQHLTITVAGTR